ncbi:TPA: hypothetical protein ACHJX8_002710 [Yersinia enterocolitica]|uniref:Uncharacterized protein n=1 Tax=Yersinia frederiksenii TaxID=29484 RepID=A0AAI8ZRI1_YERFR|nr:MULTISPECIES: hypothetical protein [Yersinia]HEC1649173.1 hypothetical protein [Yersinia enterocolitica]MCB5317433.1 hypothetical protein [Yersinia massiliensis]MDN0126522.1 hypothetical protein [Yersinia massiliensis]QKJ12824.1 hypothetical protein HRD68_20055 [Yersinia massiliensis]CFR02205.1 Uncharacterised protein [Yersinia frederiksenii]
MQKIKRDLSDLERYFRQTDQKCTPNTPWFTRWLYIPVEERMRILDDLLRPCAGK